MAGIHGDCIRVALDGEECCPAVLGQHMLRQHALLRQRGRKAVNIEMRFLRRPGGFCAYARQGDLFVHCGPRRHQNDVIGPDQFHQPAAILFRLDLF